MTVQRAGIVRCLRASQCCLDGWISSLRCLACALVSFGIEGPAVPMDSRHGLSQSCAYARVHVTLTRVTFVKFNGGRRGQLLSVDLSMMVLR